MTRSQRIRTWYDAGRNGLNTLARMEGMSPEVMAGIQHWFDQGEIRLVPIIEELEEMENAEADTCATSCN